MASINSSSSLQGLNPHAPEFRPSATVPPPSPFQPHRFSLPSLHYQEYYSLLISHPTPPPFVFSSFHYLNSSPQPAGTPPPPPPPPQPPRQPVGRTIWRYNDERGERSDYMFRRRNTTNNYSRPTRRAFASGSKIWYSERDYHDNSYNNHHHRQRSSISNSANVFVRKIQSPPVPVNQGSHETTVMIRNIPNDFTRKMLIRFLDDFCNRENNKNQYADGGDQEAVEFDFVYLPIDFSTKMNKGYAFVNFTTPKGVWRLQEANMKDQTWGFGDSIRKRREIAVAKIQGKNGLIKHFEQSRFECESDEYLPVSFSPPRDGSSGSKMRQVSQRSIGHRLQQTTTTTTSRKKPFLRCANN